MRYGKLPAQKIHGLADLSTYTGSRSCPPPRVTPPDISQWEMLGNDQLGDCTIAGAAHLVMAWDQYYHVQTPVPTQEQVEAQYLQLTGGSDTGLPEAAVLRTWHDTGLWGSDRIAMLAPVSGITAIHQCIAEFGGCYLGVQLPESAETQSQGGLPWTITPTDRIVGGHCVVAVGYDPEYLDVITWGTLQLVSYPWIDRYCDEAWGIVSAEQANAASLSLRAYEADLQSIAGA